MKPAPFALAHPDTIAAASALLSGSAGATAIAGGQSLMPMLNLRLSRPETLVPVGHLAALQGAAADPAAITIGAATTHAAIADGRCPDIGDHIFGRIAEGIAYRAIRTRGTIGGSLCHADPAADWPCTLIALGASALTWHPDGGRSIPMADFIIGAFRTILRAGEILQAVRIPRPSPQARWAYSKICRKPGEFAHAMAAVLDDPARGIRRAAIGALGGPPLLLEHGAIDPAALDRLLAGSGLDAIGRHMQIVTLRRTLDQLPR